MTGPSSRWTLRALHEAVPGRARYAVTALRHRPDLSRRVESALAGQPGIREVTVSPRTGSVLVYHNVEADRLRALLESCIADVTGAAVAAEPPAGPTPGPARRRRKHRPPRQELPDLPTSDGGPAWHAMDLAICRRRLSMESDTGLADHDARRRRERHGPNRIPESRPPGAAELIRRQVLTAPVGLLAGSAGMSVLTGGLLDAMAIGTVVFANTAVGFATERQAERVIRSMAAPVSPLVAVRRAGQTRSVHVDDVVPGDLLILTPGTTIAADARLLESARLFTDEAALTGESLPVEKQAEALCPEDAPLADRHNMVWRGTSVTGGNGLAMVVQTGLQTEMGRLQAALGSVRAPTTPMQRQLDELGTQLALASIAACAAVGAVGLARGMPLLQVMRTALSLGVAAVPEGLPAVATSTLALGIREMRRHGISVRRLDAVETLGSLQVLCLDKTGTLTQNRMTPVAVALGVRELSVDSWLAVHDVDGGTLQDGEERALSRLLETVLLCREADTRDEASPTERALFELADAGGLKEARTLERHPRIDIQFRSDERRYMATTHRTPRGGYLMAIKGSPDQVLALCGHEYRAGRRRRLSARRRLELARLNERWAARGLRVLGIAYVSGSTKPELEPGSAVWQGLVGLADPVRPGMGPLIAEIQGAGLRTVMITGDQAATAAAVGRDLDLSGTDDLRVLEAGRLSGLEPEVLAGLAHTTDVFARVSPANKLQIVRALQEDGLVVGMTGDGINDGPALKAADVGVAMGGGHPEIAAAVADVVARDDKLSTLVDAIAQGRAIYANIRKSIHFLLSTNFSEIEVMLASLTLGLPQPLNALQLLWINLVTDVFPALALALEAPESNVLEQPPRDPEEPVITREDLARMLRESGVITASALGAYGFGLTRYGAGPRAGTLAFGTLTAAQLAHAYVCRREQSDPNAPGNWWLNLAVGGSLTLQALALLFPPTRRLLGAARPGLLDLAVITAGAIGPVIVNRRLKARGRARARREDSP